MSLPIVLRLEASADVEEVRDYLDGQQPGQGQVFLERLRDTLSNIGDMPAMYGVIWRNVRAARFRQFTYVVYYRVDPSRR